MTYFLFLNGNKIKGVYIKKYRDLKIDKILSSGLNAIE